MLLRGEKSYVGVNFQYESHNMQSVCKALARLCRMGFKIAGFKFPMFDRSLGVCQVRTVLVREDAVFVLNKMLPELEAHISKVKITSTIDVRSVCDYVLNDFKGASESDGIFHCNYFALVNGLNFEKEECFEKRDYQEVEWNPEKCHLENGVWNVRNETELMITMTDEVSVIIFSEPLLSGRYMGKHIPENCVFPEVLHRIESASYRTISAKMTMLREEQAGEVVAVYNVDSKKRKRMVRLLSQEGGPFMAVVLVGPCILTNFWLTMERKLGEESVEHLRKHTLVPNTKKQVESLLVSLFDRVLPNAKVEIKTRII
jgi:hypothetical protein